MRNALMEHINLCERYGCPNQASVRVTQCCGKHAEPIDLCTKHAQELFQKDWNARHDET